jgi:thioredoxin reductase
MAEQNIKEKHPNAFPKFDDEQLKQFAKVAESHTYQDGDVLFEAGDVRSDSVKRVASAVGEGSMTVQFVHEVLKEI